MSTFSTFRDSVEHEISEFPKNFLCQQIDKGELSLRNYHGFLLAIFHQTYQGPTTFALAGANLGFRFPELRDYLIRHAEEERDHWQWVISDLRETGYQGADPRKGFPPLACQNYVSFNFYVANQIPMGRLAIASVLEGIGGRFAKHYATAAVKQLKIDPGKLKFAFGHGDTDVGHSNEIQEILERQNLSPEEVTQMSYCARTAGTLYRAMLDSAKDY